MNHPASSESLDTLEPRAGSARVQNWIVIVASAVAVLSFFLPWITHSTMGIVLEVEAGFQFASHKSAASGLPLQVFFVTPLAALACLTLALVHLKRDPSRSVSIAQIVLGVVGLLPFALLVWEFKSWTGVTATLHYIGFHTTVLGMIGIVIGAVWKLVKN